MTAARSISAALRHPTRTARGRGALRATYALDGGSPKDAARAYSRAPRRRFAEWINARFMLNRIDPSELSATTIAAQLYLPRARDVRFEALLFRALPCFVGDPPVVRRPLLVDFPRPPAAPAARPERSLAVRVLPARVLPVRPLPVPAA
jgi:hypothetical protein